MGDATTRAATGTTGLGATLHGFQPGAGVCGTSLTSSVGALHEWPPGSSGAAANARTRYPAVQAEKSFTKD